MPACLLGRQPLAPNARPVGAGAKDGWRPTGIEAGCTVVFSGVGKRLVRHFLGRLGLRDQVGIRGAASLAEVRVPFVSLRSFH